jgi:hypothetical protein
LFRFIRTKGKRQLRWTCATVHFYVLYALLLP